MRTKADLGHAVEAAEARAQAAEAHEEQTHAELGAILGTDTSLCGECGCPGNEACGQHSPDSQMGCALDRAGVCPCCKAGLKRWPMMSTENPAQLHLPLEERRTC